MEWWVFMGSYPSYTSYQNKLCHLQIIAESQDPFSNIPVFHHSNRAKPLTVFINECFRCLQVIGLGRIK